MEIIAEARPHLLNSTSVTRSSSNKMALSDGKKFEILPTPVKSESDTKEYRVIRLANGLTACLISDPSPTKETSDVEDDQEDTNTGAGEEEALAACALSVGVGSFSDPKKIPGMAHFLEHMVFMGSEKFPEENDFDSFLKSRGGSNNASTGSELTTFYFSCLEKDLSAAIDKLVQFFISPLMKRNSMIREREAVQSEFQIALQSNDHRKMQLLSGLAKSDAPVNSMSCGNLITLRDNITDDDLHETVHAFRKRHYSAHRMTAAIQARLPLDVLQSYVLKYFGDIPSNSLPADDFKQHGNVFDTPKFTKLYYMEPTTIVTQLQLTWALPSLLGKYKSKPYDYVSWLLGHEGQGSVFSYLRKKVWVLNITCECSENTSLYCLFTMSMMLTADGLKNINEIIKVVYSYINMLRKAGPQERIFNEIKQVLDIGFKFATEDSAQETANVIVEAMQYYPPEHYINGDKLLFEYDSDGIKEFLEMLLPEKMNILVFTNELPAGLTFDQTERWFGTKYTSQDISKDSLLSWKNAVSLQDFALPLPNEYISTNFEILPEEANHPEYPQQLLKTDIVEMWFRKDENFKLPTAFLYFSLINAKASESPLNMVLRDLYINLVQIHLLEDKYPAEEAKLTYSIELNAKGIILKFTGYNEKLHMLVYLFAKHIVEFEKSLDENMFLAVRDKLIKFYYNSLLNPESLDTDIRLNLTLDKYNTSAEKYNAALTISSSQLKAFSRDFIGTLRIKALAQGNITQDHAKDVVSRFADILNCRPIASSLYPKVRVFQLPIGANYCVLDSFNKNDPNSIITTDYQSGTFSIVEDVTIELLQLIVQEPLFDTLRTKEQLGYHVECMKRHTHGILGFAIMVNAQATKCTTEHVDGRIDEFVKHATTILNTMSEKGFEITKQSLIKMLQVSDVTLEEEVSRNWTEITQDYYMFDRNKKKIAAIQGPITLQTVKDWWSDHTDPKSKKFRKLSVQIAGFNVSVDENDSKTETPTGKLKLNLKSLQGCKQLEKNHAAKVILNVESFKKDMVLLPHM